ncbi:MAG: tetratricopeptide repeat protein [Phaeodactylibacter sp.]|nr:tetratricopeptide repeat protein [Phaeodactylibacter sp.]
MNKLFRFALLLVLLIPAQNNRAQITERYSEEEVYLQQLYLEANRERILGNYGKAQELFKEVLQKDPTNDAAAYELARAYNQEEATEQALKYSKKAVELLPSNIWYQQLLADIYQKAGDDRAAASIYEFLAQQDPLNEYYFDRWAYCLVRANKPEAAIDVYNQLEAKTGINEELSRRKYTLYLGLGKQKEAEAEVLALADAYPNRTEYLHILAEFYTQNNLKSKAMAVYERILQKDPGDGRAQIALTQTGESDRPDLAYLQSLKPIFGQADIDLDIKIKQLIPFVEKVTVSGDQQLADAVLELSLMLATLHPDDAKPSALSGDLYFYSRRPKKAVEQYLKTLELDDTVYLVWFHLLNALMGIEDYASMLKYSEDALDLYPNQVMINFFNGMAYGKTGEVQQGLMVLQQALFMTGNDPSLQAAIQALNGTLHFEANQTDKGKTAFDKALKLAPGNPEILAQYSAAQTEVGDFKAALQKIDSSLEADPDNHRYQAIKGWIFYQQHDYEGAKEWLLQAVENGGTYIPDILEKCGDAHFQAGQADVALKYWEAARENGIGSALLDKKIADKQLYE